MQAVNKFKVSDLHCLFNFFRSSERLTEREFVKMYSGASTTDATRSFTLAKKLELIEENGKSYSLTRSGKRFSQSKHWRLWKPTKKQLSILKKNDLAAVGISDDERPCVLDVFSGAGGLSLGFHSAGFDVAVAIDNDKEACEAHEINFPNTKAVHTDVTKISSSVSKYIKELGVSSQNIKGVVGGPPCQGFSYIGERSVSDERNLLTSHFMNIVMDIEPDFFVMENVPGLANTGIAPKFSDYIIRMSKNIGVQASNIVDRLPTIPTAVAKRDRQYRKRLVSAAIESFKQTEALEKVSPLKDYSGLVQLLTEVLSERALDAYLSENDKDLVRQGIEQSQVDINKIVISAIAVVFVTKKVLKKSFKEPEFRESFSNAKCFSSDIAHLIEDYETSPKPVMFKGTKVGPVLWHLIERASEKYEIAPPTILNAAEHGAPQARKRLFLVGIHKKFKKEYSFSSPTYWISKNGHKKPKDLERAWGCKQAIGDLPNIDLYESLISNDILPLKELKSYRSGLIDCLRGDRDNNDYALPRLSWNPYLVTNCTRTIHADHVLERIKGIPEGGSDGKSHRPRLHSEKPSNTLRAGTREGKGSHTAVRPLHYEFDRVISVREGARLMGYPDWMEFHKAKWHGMRLVGNGVPKSLGYTVAQQLIDLLYRS